MSSGHNGIDMADTYSGAVWIRDSTGVLLTVGSADLERHDDLSRWSGLLRVIANTGVAGKALRVRLELSDGSVGDAALDPGPTQDGISFMDIAGIGPAPF